MSRRLEDLQPRVQAAAARAISDLMARGVPFAITYTLRTYEEQSALYAQGRETLSAVNEKRLKAGLRPLVESENKYTVTNCDGIKISEGGKGRSPHQLGTALDVVPEYDGRPVWPDKSDERWKQISGVFKQHGFEWGGDWKDFLDLPHYQYKG